MVEHHLDISLVSRDITCIIRLGSLYLFRLHRISQLLVSYDALSNNMHLETECHLVITNQCNESRRSSPRPSIHNTHVSILRPSQILL
ncbi:hypothetical protein GJ744_007709 [Endocarpon pusillum]|uniref:Uncharacterized protein n=1 Tax=Endocarpon pusillum TaxID=364733 RepID=A0A8H7E9X1_9EURO|nr:hypothetical protein GJ744_007709 [Endocarpon pusillum]